MSEEKEQKEYKVRTKINQLANGELRYEATTRGDSVEESIALLKEVKKELEKICKGEFTIPQNDDERKKEKENAKAFMPQK